MNRMPPQLLMAAKIALPTTDNDHRNFWLGCVGVRHDGVMVSAKNGASEFSESVQQYQLQPNAHAEGRVLRKLGRRGVVYVARVAKKDGKLAMSMPCPMCQVRLRGMQVNKVYYTINESQYGIWYPETDKHTIYTV